MALIECPECGGKVSDKAVSCPHCGYPIETKSEPKALILKSYGDIIPLAYLYIRHGFPFDYVMHITTDKLPVILDIDTDEDKRLRMQKELKKLGAKTDVVGLDAVDSTKIREFKKLSITHKEYAHNGRVTYPKSFIDPFTKKEIETFHFINVMIGKLNSILGKTEAYEKAMAEREKYRNRMAERIAEVEAEEKEKKAMFERHKAQYSASSSHSPRCPNCGSPAVAPISTGKRIGSTVMFGLASKTIGKSYHCGDCDYYW